MNVVTTNAWLEPSKADAAKSNLPYLEAKLIPTVAAISMCQI